VIDDPDFIPVVGDLVVLDDEIDAIIPAGEYIVSSVNPDGSFHVGGNTAVCPCRIVARFHSFI
jgi:hypothetical protein